MRLGRAAYAYALSALHCVKMAAMSQKKKNKKKKREKRAVTRERSTFREIRELKM